MANDTNFVPVRAHLRRTSAGPTGESILQGHQPDVQAMPEGDDGAEMLPMGDSTGGMFGDVTDGASTETGYMVIGNDVVNAPPNLPRPGDFEPVPHEEREGFAGRAGGWER